MEVDSKEIASKIAQEHGLTAEAPSGSKEHVLQANVSDSTLLRRVAATSGNHLRIEGKKLVIGPPPKGEEITVAPGDGLKKMRVRIKAAGQIGEVTVHGWDPKAKREIVGKAKGEGETGEGSKKHGGSATLAFAGDEHMPADVATAEAMAKGRMRKLAEGFVTAQVEMIGNAGVQPGAVLNFDKMGEKLDGKYRVEKVQHAFGRHGYLVNFRAVRIGKKQPPKGAAAAQKQQEQTTWLDLELTTPQGRAFAGERYKVITADGQEIEGTLDANGRARLTGIRPGNNQVSFPDFAPDWRRA